MSALVAALAFSIAACNNQTGFSGSVGNTPNGPALASYQILGTVGTPFSATVSDSRSSWTLQGNVPLDIIICNNILPALVIATNQASDNNHLLSVEIIKGNHVSGVQSTMASGGTVMLQVGGTLATPAPPANPDLRIFVRGPSIQRYQALIEDIDTGFEINSRAPTLILFDTPNGKVTGQFFGRQNFGTFDINLTLCMQTTLPIPCVPRVVATVMQGPDATIREP